MPIARTRRPLPPPIGVPHVTALLPGGGCSNNPVSPRALANCGRIHPPLIPKVGTTRTDKPSRDLPVLSSKSNKTIKKKTKHEIQLHDHQAKNCARSPPYLPCSSKCNNVDDVAQDVRTEPNSVALKVVPTDVDSDDSMPALELCEISIVSAMPPPSQIPSPSPSLHPLNRRGPDAFAFRHVRCYRPHPQ